jgi:hypothetical protein
MIAANHPGLSRMAEIPAGKTVRDFLPQFSEVKQEHGPIGLPCRACASCCKPFTAARKRRLAIKCYPIHCAMPMAFLYDLCGQCTHRYRAGGVQKDRVLAAMEKFILGDRPAA